jgi:hypothetical protein
MEVDLGSVFLLPIITARGVHWILSDSLRVVMRNPDSPNRDLNPADAYYFAEKI